MFVLLSCCKCILLSIIIIINNIIFHKIIIKNIILQHYSNDTHKQRQVTRSGALPCQHGSGNGSSQSDIQPAVDVCQDGRFGRGHANGKVGCQPRESEVSLLTPVAEGLHR